MKLFKSILLILHLQAGMVLLFLGGFHLGIPAFAPTPSALKNLLAWCGVLMALYAVIAFIMGQLKPNIHAWPTKALVLWILLFGLYTASFIWAQKQAIGWLLFGIGHYPMGWHFQPILPSTFDLTYQFTLSLGTFSPALGLKFGFFLSHRVQRLQRKPSK